MYRHSHFVLLLTAAAWAQGPAPEAGTPDSAREYVVPSGTKVALSLIKSISTKESNEGDAVYLKTAFPVLAGGRIVIPVGSHVLGSVTHVKKPGKAKGRGELYIRFDSLILDNGVTRDFRARMGGVDALASGELDRAEGKVKSEGNKSGDARTIGEAAGAGASIGAIAGSAAGKVAMGAGIGAAAGAAAGLIAVLASRGPDAILPSGTTVEMVLDRPLTYKDNDLIFPNGLPRSATSDAPVLDKGSSKGGGILFPRR